MGQASPPGADPASPASPVALLLAAVRAQQVLDYAGIERVTAASLSADTGRTGAMAGQVLQVVHDADGDTLVGLPAAAGSAARRVVVSDSAPGAVSSLGLGLDLRGLTLLRAHYRLQIEGHASVAGRPVVIVAAARPRGYDAARFWLDTATALPLREEYVDSAGEVVQASSFSSIAIGAAGEAAWARRWFSNAGAGVSGATGGVAGEPSGSTSGTGTTRLGGGVTGTVVANPAGSAIASLGGLGSGGSTAGSAAAPDGAQPAPERAVPASQLAVLRDDGWCVPAALPGGFELFDARIEPAGSPRIDGRGSGATVGTDEMLHLSYTDGLSTVSLFEQRGRLRAAPLPGWQAGVVAGHRVWRSTTSPESLAWSDGTHVYTLVADLPGSALDAAAGSLPHERPAAGFLERLAHSLLRLLRSLNPF